MRVLIEDPDLAQGLAGERLRGAERWGTVRKDVVALSLPLTHALLADMVAASRPAVTAALSALTKRRRVQRDRDLWLLRGGPPAEFEEVGASAVARP